MKIIVLDRGWVEYRVEDNTSIDELLTKIKTLYRHLPDADIYLDWNDNAVFIDPATLKNNSTTQECLH